MLVSHLSFIICIARAMRANIRMPRPKDRLPISAYLITAGAAIARSRPWPWAPYSRLFGGEGGTRDGLRSGPSVWTLPPASFRRLSSCATPFFLQADGRMTRDEDQKVWTAWPLRARRTCHSHLVRPNFFQINPCGCPSNDHRANALYFFFCFRFSS